MSEQESLTIASGATESTTAQLNCQDAEALVVRVNGDTNSGSLTVRATGRFQTSDGVSPVVNQDQSLDGSTEKYLVFPDEVSGLVEVGLQVDNGGANSTTVTLEWEVK